MKNSRDWEAVTWADFQELFMSKFFSTMARYAKAREFLRLCNTPNYNLTVLSHVLSIIKVNVYFSGIK